MFFNAQNEFTWQNTVLLAPLCTTDNDDIVRKKIGATAIYLDIWLMRRAVNYIRVGYSSATYSMFLLCRDIRRKSLLELVNILTQKLNNDDVTFDGSPSKRRKGINDLYLNQFSRRYIYHLLARLTAYIEVGAGLPDITASAHTGGGIPADTGRRSSSTIHAISNTSGPRITAVMNARLKMKRSSNPYVIM